MKSTKSPEVMVGLLDEGRVHLHLPGVHALRLGRQAVPRRNVGIVFGQHRVSRHDSLGHLPLEHDAAILVPSSVEAARVLLDPLGFHMVRRVPGAQRVVHEERLVGRVDVGVLHELDGVVGEIDVEVVALLRRGGCGNRMVVVHEVGEPVIGRSRQEAVEPLEARPSGHRLNGPAVVDSVGAVRCHLPYCERVVAVLEKHLGRKPCSKPMKLLCAGKPSDVPVIADNPSE